MFPPGFLGSRADVLVDIVTLSLVVIMPLLVYSYRLARAGEWIKHRNLMITLAAVLTVVVGIFEYDLQVSGGAFELAKESRFAGTLFLAGSIYFHLLVAVMTALLWYVLIFLSWRKFSRPPEPGAFSKTHKLLGKIGMIGMFLTGITGVELYIVSFVL